MDMGSLISPRLRPSDVTDSRTKGGEVRYETEQFAWTPAQLLYDVDVLIVEMLL